MTGVISARRSDAVISLETASLLTSVFFQLSQVMPVNERRSTRTADLYIHTDEHRCGEARTDTQTAREAP